MLTLLSLRSVCLLVVFSAQPATVQQPSRPSLERRRPKSIDPMSGRMGPFSSRSWRRRRTGETGVLGIRLEPRTSWPNSHKRSVSCDALENRRVVAPGVGTGAMQDLGRALRYRNRVKVTVSYHEQALRIFESRLPAGHTNIDVILRARVNSWSASPDCLLHSVTSCRNSSVRSTAALRPCHRKWTRD